MTLGSLRNSSRARLAPTRRWRQALVLVAFLGTWLAEACKGESETSELPRAKSSASRVAEGSVGLDEWTQLLEPQTLKGVDLSKPEAVVAALRERRAKTNPIFGMVLAQDDGDDAGSKPSRAQELRLQADRFLKEGYKVRDNPVRHFDQPIAWGDNPKKDRNWQYVVNSLDPLRPLLNASRRPGGSRYYRVVKGAMLDWIEYNLIKNKKNKFKWHDMGTGKRAYVLAGLVDRELREKRPAIREVQRLVWALHRHVEFLADPKSFSKSNHGIFMVQGLGWLLKALPELKGARQRQKYALQKLSKLVSMQFTADAFHREHSPAYHLFTSATFKRLEEQGPFGGVPDLERTLAHAASHVEELYHPNGSLVALGDTDRGVDQADKDRAEQLLGPTEGGYSASGKRQIGPLRVYRDTGYAIFRSGWGSKPTLVDDFLFVGAAYHSGAHKHADHLSFEWSFRGQPILVDSGKYSYSNNKWREYFVSTRAGNAVEVDGKDYAHSRKYASGSALSDAGEVNGVYYVYCRQRHPRLAVDQDRLFLWQPARFLLVVDEMTSRKEHTYRQWFQFHESLEVESAGSGLSVKVAPAGRLSVQQLAPGFGKRLPSVERSSTKDARGTGIELVRGQTKPRILGWISPKHSVKRPRDALAFRQSGKSATFVTLFAGPNVATPKVRQKGHSLEFEFAGAKGGGLRFSPDASPPVVALKP